MESLGETKKRKEHSPDNETPKKFRSTNTDTLSYLRERSEREYQLREQEMYIKIKENRQTTKMMIINVPVQLQQQQEQQQVIMNQQASMQHQITLQNSRIEGMLGSLLDLIKNK